MGDAGIFGPEERVELIDGDVIDVARPSSQCAGTLDHVAELLYRAVGDLAQIRVRNPILFDPYSEFQPDLAVVKRRADYYASAHPQPHQVLLVVEVVDAAVRADRDSKLLTYGRHGIPEVWLIDTETLRLTRYRAPREGTYSLVEQPALEIPIVLDALSDARVELRPLFAHVKSVAPGESTDRATQ
jgi:Uma2 family endonuclease